MTASEGGRGATPFPQASTGEIGRKMKTHLACMAALALVGAAGEARAQNGFEVLEIDDNSGCRLTASYSMPGRSTVRLSIDQQTGGEIFVMVQSYGWSRPSSGDETTMGLVFQRAGSDERTIFALFAVPLGVEMAAEQPGMLGQVEPERAQEFRSALARSSAVRVLSRPADSEADFAVLLEAGLPGSAAASTSLGACVARVKRREDARLANEARVAHIERDPFARPRDGSD